MRRTARPRMRAVSTGFRFESTWQCWGRRQHKARPLPQVAETVRVLAVGDSRTTAGWFETMPAGGMQVQGYRDKDFRYATILCRSSGFDTAIVIVVFGTIRGAPLGELCYSFFVANPNAAWPAPP